MRITIVLAAVMFIISPLQGQTYLENITAQKVEDSIQVDVLLSATCAYEHFLTKTAPERIVIDLKKVINNWPRKNYTALPFASLAGIRTSQYQSSPSPVARVVLDVNRPVAYSVVDLPQGIRIKFPAVSGEKAVGIWEAKPTPGSPIQSSLVPKSQAASTPTSRKATGQPQTKQALVPVPENQQKSAESSARHTAADSSVTAPSKPSVVPGVPLAPVPERKVAHYVPAAERDPFRSLIGSAGVQLGTGKLPAVENLTLVGVLHEDGKSQALFEDAEGRGYILKPDDPVKNGRLVSIQKDKAIFQITEYGWTRTVALNLQLPELK